MNTKNRSKKAFAIIEIILAIAIFAIFSTGVLYLSLDTIQRDKKIQLSNEALRYAQEGLEAARMIYEADPMSIEGGDYGLNLDTNWSFTAAPEDIDGFYSRTITVEDVYRDESNEIAEAGTLDPNIKKITAEVTWQWHSTLSKSVSLTTYLANWSSFEWMQTTCTEFEAGTFSDTEIGASDPPPDDDCILQLRFLEEPTPFFSSIDVGKHGNDVLVEDNYSYLATASAGYGLNISDISDASSPINIIDLGIGGKGRYVFKDGNYIYVAVEKSNGGLSIVDVSNPSAASVLSTTNVGAYGNEIAVSGDYLYMGTADDDDSFKIYNITNKSAPSLASDLDLDEEVKAVQLSGNYAYLGVNDSTAGFQIVDISNPNNPSQVASLNLGAAVNAIYLDGAFAYVGLDSTSNSLKVIDISDPETPSLLTTLDVGGKIEDIAITDNYLYAPLDQVTPGLAVVNVLSPLSPYLAFNMDILGKGTGIDTDNHYAYIGTDISNRGLVIIETIDGTISTSGYYISDTLDLGSSDARFNYLEWDASIATGGTMQLQIRTADTEAHLSSATWVGPDGTSSTYYDTSRTEIELDPARSGQRYLQIKIDMTSDGSSNSAIEYFLINYTP